MAKFRVGDRVFYNDNGPADRGTVRAINSVDEQTVYDVHWDGKQDKPSDEPDGFYAGQLTGIAL